MCKERGLCVMCKGGKGLMCKGRGLCAEPRG